MLSIKAAAASRTACLMVAAMSRIFDRPKDDQRRVSSFSYVDPYEGILAAIDVFIQIEMKPSPKKISPKDQ
jgi:hypothetical protein